MRRRCLSSPKLEPLSIPPLLKRSASSLILNPIEVILSLSLSCSSRSFRFNLLNFLIYYPFTKIWLMRRRWFLDLWFACLLSCLNPFSRFDWIQFYFGLSLALGSNSILFRCVCVFFLIGDVHLINSRVFFFSITERGGAAIDEEWEWL